MTSNLEEIRAFGGGWNGGLIFTPAGESIITLDVDNKNGKQRSEGLAHLLAFHGPLPKTLEWRTPSGGRQIIFRPGPHRIPKSVGTLGKRAGQEISGLDVIGLGAITVLPGSVRPDGAVEWLSGLSVDDVDICEIPDWLAKVMLKAAGEYRTKREREYPRHGVHFAWGSHANGYAKMTRRAEEWLRAAVTGKANGIASAPNGQQECTLNGAAFHLGMKIATLRARGFLISPNFAEHCKRDSTATAEVKS
jgi:hypothetical protein